MPEPILYESHMHTPLCRHAIGEPEEYAVEAERKGLKGIIVTCHNPIPDGYSENVRMRESEFEAYVACVERAARAFAGRVDVRLGIECDYAPELERSVAELLKRAEFHHVLGSVHTQVGEYRARYFIGDYFAYQKLYFEHLAMAAESGLFDTLSHPDLVKNESPEDWVLERIMPDVRASLDRIAATGVAMELNTSGVMKAIPEMNPGSAILRQMAEREIPVVIGADAHVPERTGDRFPEALGMLRAAGYENVSLYLARERREISIETALASLA